MVTSLTTSNPVQGHDNSIDEGLSALPTTRKRVSGADCWTGNYFSTAIGGRHPCHPRNLARMRLYQLPKHRFALAEGFKLAFLFVGKLRPAVAPLSRGGPREGLPG